MKGLLFTAMACAAVAVSGSSAAKSPAAAPMKLTLSGEGKWAVQCMFEAGNGNIDRESFKGGKAGPVAFSIAKLQSGDCTYKIASDHPMTIAMDGDQWSCPFNVPVNAKCEQTFAPAASGSFRIIRRSEN